MTLYERERTAAENTEYFVILAAGSQLREWVDWPPLPLRLVVKRLVQPRVDGDLSHHVVRHHGSDCSLFVDRDAQLKKKPKNVVAT